MVYPKYSIHDYWKELTKFFFLLCLEDIFFVMYILHRYVSFHSIYYLMYFVMKQLVTFSNIQEQ